MKTSPRYTSKDPSWGRNGFHPNSETLPVLENSASLQLERVAKHLFFSPGSSPIAKVSSLSGVGRYFNVGWNHFGCMCISETARFKGTPGLE